MVLFGIPFHAHWFFWIMMALLGGAGAARTPADWLGVGLFMLAGTVSIGCHELGHALTGRRFGARQPTIELTGLGGLCTFQSAAFRRWQEFLMIAAGPLANAVLAVVFGLLLAFRGEEAPPMVAELMLDFLWINVVWGLFNVLPIHPLDGGQMMRVLLGPRRLSLTFIVSIATTAALFPLAMRFGSWTVILLAFLAWHNIQDLMAARR